MIFDMNSAKDLFEKYKAAHVAEGIAITNLHDAMLNSTKDIASLMVLANRMTEAQNETLSLWNQLQKHRLDT